jgi:hypothetical protein
LDIRCDQRVIEHVFESTQVIQQCLHEHLLAMLVYLEFYIVLAHCENAARQLVFPSEFHLNWIPTSNGTSLANSFVALGNLPVAALVEVRTVLACDRAVLFR